MKQVSQYKICEKYSIRITYRFFVLHADKLQSVLNERLIRFNVPSPFQLEFLTPDAINLYSVDTCDEDQIRKNDEDVSWKISFSNIHLNASAYDAPLNISRNRVSL